MPNVLLDAAGRRRSPATMLASTPAHRRATRVTDGSKIKLAGAAEHRRVFGQLRDLAAAGPVGTVPPAPKQPPELSVVRALARLPAMSPRVPPATAGTFKLDAGRPAH